MKNENFSIEQIYKTELIIWFALLVSQIMFLLVIFLVKPEVYQFDFTKSVFGENAIIIFGFAFIAVLNLIISFVMKKNLLKNAVEHQNPALVQNAMIIACALCESISLLGFVIAIAFSFQLFFIFFIVGIIGTIFHFPKRENLHSAVYKETQKF